MKPYGLDNIVSMMDGAICTNNPTDCIYADIIKMYPEDKDIKILSLGNAKYEFPKYSIKKMKSWEMKILELIGLHKK